MTKKLAMDLWTSWIRIPLAICLLLLLATTARAAGPKRHADLIVRGDYVVTMDEAMPLIRDGAVAISGGRIVAVGSARDVLSAYRGAPISGRDRVVMPGLVNGHTHAAMTLFRGVADDLELIEWLTEFIFPLEAEFVDPEFVRLGTELACWEMIRGGTTTFVDMYFYPDAVAEAVDACGLRAIVSPVAIDFPSPGFEGWDDSFAAAVDFARRRTLRPHPRILPAIAPHAPYTVAPEHLVQAFDAARRLGVPIHTHLAETLTEVEDILTRYGNRPVNHLDATGVLFPKLIAAHVVWPDAQEIELLARRGIGVVHNPVSNMKLASGRAPVPAMLKAGVAVGLGTDGAASNNDLDMWEEMNLASLIHKGSLLDPTVLPAATVLRMATLGTAEAISLDQEIGALTVGRRADLLQLRLDRPHLTPLYDVVSHLVYAADAADVVTVIVEGRVLMRRSQVLTVDERAVRSQARRVAEEIEAWLASRETARAP